MTFAKVQDYLDAILAHAVSNDIFNSPHGQFWRTMSYEEFTTLDLPHVKCHQQPIKIINADDPKNSPFFLVLQSGWCSKPQMPPDDDPKISDPTYSVALPDGTTVSGQKMIDDIGEWLENGFPE